MAAPVSISLRAFNWTLLVEVRGRNWEHSTVWLRAVVPYLLQNRLLLGSEEIVLPQAFVEYTRLFKATQLTMDGFRTAYQLASTSPAFTVHVLSVEDTGSAEAGARREAMAKAAQQERARLCKNVAKKVVALFEHVRDENAAQLALVVAKSQRQVQFARSLFMREDATTGRRVRLRGPYGVAVPLPFPAPSVVTRNLAAVAVRDENLYVTDNNAGQQIAPLVRVVEAILLESRVVLQRDRVYPFVLLDHVDALSVPGGKRSLCTLWLVNPDMFGGGGRSHGKRWFDFEGSVQLLDSLAVWRAAEVSTVLGQRVAVGGAFVEIRVYYVLGDNERQQIEMGGNTGSSPCRCFACFLPADLFPFLPRAGHARSLAAANAAHHALVEANVRLDMLDSLGAVRVQLKTAAHTHLRVAFGNITYQPLLAMGATFPLEMVRFSLPVLHDVAQVLLVVKKFLNTLLSDDERLPTKEYISAAERRNEMSHWADTYGALDPTWLFVADCASQLTATLWSSTPVTYGGALRAQVCGLVLHFVISTWKPDEAQTNYLHGLAAHLLGFLLPLVPLGVAAVHFFEEEGERCTAVVREFLATRSNHRDNLFAGVRTYERLTGSLTGAERRRRRLRTAAPTFTNLIVAPCILSGSCAHADTLASLLAEIMESEPLAALVSRAGDSLVFHVGVADAAGVVEETLVCCCGRHVAPDAVIGAEPPLDEWRHDIAQLVQQVPVLSPHSYDALALLLNSPFGHAPKFHGSRALELMMAVEPPSARRKELEKLKLPDLRERCRVAGLPNSGNKDALVERILAASGVAEDADAVAVEATPAAAEGGRAPANDPAADDEDFQRLSLAALRARCAALQLAQYGSKATIIARIRNHSVSERRRDSGAIVELAARRKRRQRSNGDVADDGDDGAALDDGDDPQMALAEAVDDSADASPGGAAFGAQDDGRRRRHAATQNPFLFFRD
jgi:hypothetical protein